MAKPILVVLTGGTIGSCTENGGIGLHGNVARIVGDYTRVYGAEAFEVRQPLTLLSENMTPPDWQTLCECLSEADFDRFAGVIVCHGSDTLPYTAALLGYLFRHSAVPLLLVASNRPLEAVGANGLHNFAAAVDFIRHEGIPGVYVPYENDRGEMRVYLATRLLEADPYRDQFASFGGVDLGYMQDGRFCLTSHPQNPTLAELKTPPSAIACPRLSPERSVALIRPYPGLDYRQFHWAQKPCAVLHTDYHSDTASTAAEPYGLPGFVARCAEEGVPVYLCALRQTHIALYDTTRRLLSHGVIPLFSLSMEAALMKLYVAYNQTEMTPEQYLSQDIAYEIVENA